MLKVFPLSTEPSGATFSSVPVPGLRRESTADWTHTTDRPGLTVPGAASPRQRSQRVGLSEDSLRGLEAATFSLCPLKIAPCFCVVCVPTSSSKDTSWITVFLYRLILS